MISKFFIERPVLANVLAIVIVLIGSVALATLPVSQYPNIVPPTVQVTTTYPGASADTLVNNVALPIDLQVNGVENMIYMSSTSTDQGTYTLTVTFTPADRANYQSVTRDVTLTVAAATPAVTVGGTFPYDASAHAATAAATGLDGSPASVSALVQGWSLGFVVAAGFLALAGVIAGSLVRVPTGEALPESAEVVVPA